MTRILLADDDSDDRELFFEAVQALELAVHCDTVSDGSEALAKLNNLNDPLPDLIILDINMPNVNGWTTLKTIRNQQRLANTPVFIYTTSSNQRDRQIAADLGANGFFTKPERFEEVKEMIRQVIVLTISREKGK